MLTYLPMIEVVDSVNNWCSLTLMTRWMSHEALAFMRVMADLRWMSGLGKVCWTMVSMTEDDEFVSVSGREGAGQLGGGDS